MNKLAVLEGLLFVVGDEGLSLSKIEEIMEIDDKEAKDLLMKLRSEYEKADRGLRISFLADTFKLTTKKEHIDYYKKLITTNNDGMLSQAALETLAVIAYNQPITRVKIDEMRGIASSFLIRKLLAKDLIAVCGKSDLPGHPNLYRTTSTFLDYFGLATIADLPDISYAKESDENVDLYTSKYTEQ